MVSHRAYENALQNLRECRERRPVLSSAPLKLYLEPTDRCALRCCYCYPPVQKRHDQMTMDLFHQIGEQLFDDCCEVNLFLSGEPALAPNLSRMLAECSRHPFITKTFTSLSFQRDDLLKEFVEKGVWVNVSFDGIEATRQLRCGSNLELILSNLRALGEYRRAIRNPRFYLRLAAVVGKHNAVTLRELVCWAQRQGFDEVQVGCLDTFPGIDHLALTKEDVEHFEQAVAEADRIGLRISCPSHIGGERVSRPTNWQDTTQEIDEHFPHFVETCNPDVERRFCPYPWIQTLFAANGEVVSCCQKKIPMGHFGPGVDFIRDIWNNGMYQALRRLEDHHGCRRWLPAGASCHMLSYSIWGGETVLSRIERLPPWPGSVPP